MANFSELGGHCYENLCKQQDFLPFKCNYCNHIYCLTHRTDHKCTTDITLKNKMPLCQICNSYIHVPANESSPDRIMDLHINSNCQEHKLDEHKSQHELSKSTCNFKNCKKHELIPITCGLCKLQFCVKHRHDIDHNCSGLIKASNIKPALNPPPKTNSTSVTPIVSRPKIGSKLPPHIRLMQLKAKALGGPVDEIDRIIYEVNVSNELLKDLSIKKSQEYTKAAPAINFNRNWTIGRCIDQACNVIGLTNRNNEPNSRKIAIALNNGLPLPTDLNLNLLLPEIPNGSSLELVVV